MLQPYRLVIISFVIFLLLRGTAPLTATPGVNDYPYNNEPVGRSDPWGFYMRYCTSFVAWRLNKENGMAFMNVLNSTDGGRAMQLSHAKYWGGKAAELGYAVNTNPAVGSVAWTKGGEFGHVAWVKEVKSDTVVIEDYNNNWSYAYDKREVRKDSFDGYIHFKDIAQNKIVRIKKSKFGDSHQIYTATKHKVFENWWRGDGLGVRTGLAFTAPGGEEITDIDKITQPDGTQNLYIATNAGVYEVWWRGGGFSSPGRLASLPGVSRIVIEVKNQGGSPLYTLYALASDGPYSVSWRAGGGITAPYFYWNINNGVALVKSKSYDGLDEVYAATDKGAYRMKWPVAGDIQRKVVTTLADTVDIAKQTLPGGTELFYTATKTGVHETWWKPGTGFSLPGKIITVSDPPVRAVEKHIYGSAQQVYVATDKRVYEFWWAPGSNGIRGSVLRSADQAVVDIEKVTNGDYQNVYSAQGESVYETWWGNGAFNTGRIINLAGK